MSGYTQGRRVEYAAIHDLMANGYAVIRAAGSKGPADIVAIKDGQVLFISVKRQRPPSPAERVALMKLANYLPGTLGHAIVAMSPPGKGLEYRRLWGVAPNAHDPWSPDYAR